MMFYVTDFLSISTGVKQRLLKRDRGSTPAALIRTDQMKNSTSDANSCSLAKTEW